MIKHRTVPDLKGIEATSPHDRLKAVRKTLGLVQADMAAKLDISARAYSYYEQGERDIPAALIVKVLMIDNMCANWFLFGETN